MRYDVLGGLAVRAEGGPLDLGGPKQRLVLAFLLLAEGRPLAADRLVELVWGEDPPVRVSTSLQTYVSNLRRLLEPERGRREEPTVLRTRPGGYALELDRRQLDLHRFEDLVREAEELQRRGEPQAAAGRLAAALATWAPLLPEFGDEPAVRDAARRLDALHLVALERWFDTRLALGEAMSLLPELGDAVATSPLHERFRAQLALALYRSGRQTDALRALADARRTLTEEVGVEPGPELRSLEADILDQSPSLGVPLAAPGPVGPLAPADGDAPPAAPFLGRERELAVALAALERSAGGAGTAVVVSGEPGIGKTRIAEEVAARARERGLAVAWARCPETAASPSFGPLAEVAEALRTSGVADLPVPSAGSDGVDGDPAALRRAVVQALRSATGPAVVVLDDLQWADPASLRLVEYVAGDLADLRVLLLVTTRPPGADAPTALVECLGELARAAGSVRLAVEGLGVEAVGRWVQARLGRPGGPEVARFVHDRSGGNPFFTSELLALLDPEALDPGALAALRVPDAVADVVRRRVGRLPGPTQQVLSAASVLGAAFDLDVVAEVVDAPMDELLAALDPALGAGLVAEDPPSLVGYRFSHVLVAEALASELAPSRRAGLHARAVSAIESTRAGRLDASAAELAHHALAGARAGTAGAAVTWSVRAAEVAETALAPEDAAGHYERALRAAELAAPADLRLRYRLLVSLARARSRAGSEERAQSALADAIALADRLEDVPAMAAAAGALAHATLWQPGGYREGNARLVRLVDLVLGRLGLEADPGDRADLLGFRASLGYYASSREEVDRQSAEAVALARRSGRPERLARALVARLQAIWVPGEAVRRRDLADELATLARAEDLRPDVESTGRLARLVAAYELGEVDDAELEALGADVRRDGSPLAQLEVATFRAARLGSRGRYGEALEVADAAGELFRRTGRRSAGPSLLASTVLSLLDTGRLDELAAAGGEPPDPAFAVASAELLAFVLAEAGRPDEARAVIGPLGSVPDLPYDWLWLAVNHLAALTRTALGDAEASAVLESRLAPSTGLVPMPGLLPSFGAVDLALGRLAASRDDGAVAVAHLDRAIALDDRMGARPWLARGLEARWEVARVRADRERALRLAEEIGCEPVLRRLAAG